MFIGTGRTVCGAGSMNLWVVRPSVRLSQRGPTTANPTAAGLLL